MSEAARVGQAIVRVLADSTRTSEIHVVEELTGRSTFRRYLQALRDDPEMMVLLEERPELCSAQVDYDALRLLPEGSLGGAYVHHLDRHGLSADSQAAPTRHIDDPDLAYLMRRYRQTHDVWHALLGLGVEGHEEVLVHAFSWGQLRLPVSGLVLFFGSLKHMVGEGRWRTLSRAVPATYRAGRRAEPLLPVYWERHWTEPLAKLRERYGIVTVS